MPQPTCATCAHAVFSCLRRRAASDLWWAQPPHAPAAPMPPPPPVALPPLPRCVGDGTPDASASTAFSCGGKWSAAGERGQGGSRCWCVSECGLGFYRFGVSHAANAHGGRGHVFMCSCRWACKFPWMYDKFARV
eukprot:365451-Chlamydomonas_euryale.AAC.14